jgi:NTP pyrophosphohydrolases containing a Zn-finger, probably nucleic-acid-binding
VTSTYDATSLAVQPNSQYLIVCGSYFWQSPKLKRAISASVLEGKDLALSINCLPWVDERDLAQTPYAECSRLHLAHLNETPLAIALVENLETDLSVDEDWIPLRSLLGCLAEPEFQLCGRAVQLRRWYLDHRFCGRCGAQTEIDEIERCRTCHHCRLQTYPRLSPCVIGLIVRGEECLLARGAKHPDGMFSTLAGFIEPGETAEQAFVRETMEEVGIVVNNLRYVGSQPWPFPSQLMIGFVADYVSGEICVDDNEIIEAAWFRYDQLPRIPPQSTIAGEIIRNFQQQMAEL